MRNGVGGSKMDLAQRLAAKRSVSLWWLLAGLSSPGMLLLVSSPFLLPLQSLQRLGVELVLWGRCQRCVLFP